jgi:hypothetical protein
MKDSRDRMFNTQFPGLDVAGLYIAEHKQPNDRLLHSSRQSFGVLWHSQTGGYKPPRDVEYLELAQEQYSVNWIFAYQWGIQRYFQDPQLMDYIRQNYRLVQIGFIPQGETAQPLYFLFRRGGTFNDSALNELLENKQMYSQQYFYTHTPYEIRYINVE